MITTSETPNFELFRDCLSPSLIQKFASSSPTRKAKRKGDRRDGRKKSRTLTRENGIEDDGNGGDAEELSEFVDYIATEIFLALSPDLRTLTYTTYTNSAALQSRYTAPLSSSATADILCNLDPSTTETLTTYGLLPAHSTPADLIAPILSSYLSAITAPPLSPLQTKDLATGCEICLRSHVPLTYHHLIPRMVHEKAVKRGWHTREELGNVAWLCRACHSFVHSKWGHEVLARELFTVERLLEKEQVVRWAGWVGKVRWKTR